MICIFFFFNLSVNFIAAPLQYSCLENPMDGGAWWAAVHGVTKSRTDWATSLSLFHFHALEKEMATHSSFLAWRIPGTGEPGGVTSMGSRRVGHDWSDLIATCLKGAFLVAQMVKNLPIIVGFSEDQGNLACCSPRSHKQALLTNWTIICLILMIIKPIIFIHLTPFSAPNAYYSDIFTSILKQGCQPENFLSTEWMNEWLQWIRVV